MSNFKLELDDITVAQWKMNDNSDSYSVENSIVASHSFESSKNTSDITVEGRINEALSFDGVGDMLLLADTFRSPDNKTNTGIGYDSTDDCLWVADFDDTTVRKVNKTTGQKILEFSVAPSTLLQGVTYDSSDDTIWVSDRTIPSILHFAKDGTFLSGDTISLASLYLGADIGPNGISYDPGTINATEGFWVVDNDTFTSRVHKINKSTGAIDITLNITGSTQNADGVTYDHRNGSLWVTIDNGAFSETVRNIDSSTGNTISFFKSMYSPEDITFDTTDNTLWINNDEGFHVFGGVPDAQHLNRIYHRDLTGQFIKPNVGTYQKDFSVSFWVYFDSLPNQGHGIVASDTEYMNLEGNWGFIVDGADYLRWYGTSGGDRIGVNGSGAGSPQITSGQWYHVVGTYDGVLWILYLDKEPYTNTNAESSEKLLDDPNGFIRVGAVRTTNDANFWFRGKIDNLMIFDRVLTTEEVDFLYNGGTGTEDISGGFPIDSGETYEISSSKRLKFTGTTGQEATVRVNNVDYTIGDVSGNFVWDKGGSDEHTFTSEMEAILREYESGKYFSVAYKGTGSQSFDIRILGDLVLDNDVTNASNKEYYKAPSGDSNFDSDTWYVNSNKKHAHKIFSDFDPIEDV